MKHKIPFMHRVLRQCALILLLISATAEAQTISSITIAGSYLGGIVGTEPVTAEYSWITNTLEYGGKHTWTYGPGSSGGVVFGTAQPYTYLPPDDLLTGISSKYVMFNVDTVLYSVNGGITIDANNTIDMANLRMLWGTNVMDYGSGAGTSTLIPLVQDITALSPGDSGWMINPDGTYHLIYESGAGLCGTACATTIHFYGQVAYVPLLPAFWLLGSGMFVILGMRRRPVSVPALG